MMLLTVNKYAYEHLNNNSKRWEFLSEISIKLETTKFGVMKLET